MPCRLELKPSDDGHRRRLCALDLGSHDVRHRQAVLGTGAVHDVEAMPHRLLGRQCRDHDLIRMERVDGAGQGPQRPIVTQFAVSVEVLGAQGGQRVVQPLLRDRPGRFPDVERTVGGCGSGLDRAGRHDDVVVGVLSAPMRRSSSSSSRDPTVWLASTSTRCGRSVAATPSTAGRRFMNHLFAKNSTITTAHDSRLSINASLLAATLHAHLHQDRQDRARR